jgi:hypothetical protein
VPGSKARRQAGRQAGNYYRPAGRQADSAAGREVWRCASRVVQGLGCGFLSPFSSAVSCGGGGIVPALVRGGAWARVWPPVPVLSVRLGLLALLWCSPRPVGVVVMLVAFVGWPWSPSGLRPCNLPLRKKGRRRHYYRHALTHTHTPSVGVICAARLGGIHGPCRNRT